MMVVCFFRSWRWGAGRRASGPREAEASGLAVVFSVVRGNQVSTGSSQGAFDPKCQKGLSGLLALASPAAALQMTLFVCLQRQPGRRRRS